MLPEDMGVLSADVQSRCKTMDGSDLLWTFIHRRLRNSTREVMRTEEITRRLTAMRLDGKRVIIIGGSSGIGLETARLALAEGASVLIAGRSEERLRKAAADLNSDKLRTAVADISDETSIQTMFAAEKQIDHVFLPAGELRPGGGDVLETDMRDLESLLKIRLLGVVNVVRQVRSKMKSGSITLMSGLYSTRPGKGGAMGAAGVAAIEGMTRALALDLAPLRVNAVAPGLIDTPLWNTFGPHRDAIMAMGASLPVGRIGKPEDVASGVLFLMQNDFVTGSVLTIDGGGSLV